MKPHGFLSVLFLFLLAAATVAATTLPQQAGERQYRPPDVVRVGGHVQATKLLHRIMPVYPPEAKRAGIQGTVILHALIGRSGRVEALKYVSGPPILVKAALEAVRHWEYEPTLLNGRPVKVKTEITVIFSLGHPNKPKPEFQNPSPDAPRTSAEPCGPPFPPPEPIRIGEPGQAAKLTHRVVPVYRPEAKEKGIQGTVVLHAVIGKDGHVKKLKAVSGDPMLAEAAEAAVQQWAFRPTHICGRAVEVETKIIVIFSLGGSHTTKIKANQG